MSDFQSLHLFIKQYPYFVNLDVKFGSSGDSMIHNTLLNLKVNEWLLEAIGERDVDWVWTITEGRFYFRTEENRIKFILRWA